MPEKFFMQSPWYEYAAEKLSELSNPTKTPVGNFTYDFVLPADRATCANFDSIYTHPLCLQTYLPPVPFVGNPETAKVILLAANPGFVKRESAEYDNERTFVEESLKSLRFESDYPLHYLDPRFAGYEGFRWWKQVIGDVVNQAAGVDSETASKRKHIIGKFACVEWLPYHSNSFDKSPKNAIFNYTLASQHYTQWLVNQAIDREAQLVVIWGRPHREMWTRFLGRPFPQGTIFPRPEAVRPKDLRPSHFTQSDIDRVAMILAT